MAGCVIVSRTAVISMGSHHFRYLMATMREYFDKEDLLAEARLFDYFDVSSDCLVVLADCDKSDFLAFSSAFERALRAEPDMQDYLGRGLLEELGSKLRADPRYEIR